MKATTRSIGAWLVLASMAAGCGGKSDSGLSGPADPVLDGMSAAALGTAEQVQSYASASAAGVYGFVVAFQAMATGQQPEGTMCPAIVQNGATTTVQGGCTDAAGKTYAGTIVSTRNADGTRIEVQYQSWRVTNTRTCGTQSAAEELSADGSTVFTTRGGDDVDFQANLIWHQTTGDAESCAQTTRRGAMDYAGTVRAVGTGEARRYEGSGRLGIEPTGTVETRTVAELIDPTQCPLPPSDGGNVQGIAAEPSSGTTTLRAGDATVVISYDGAADCDPTGTARWSYNGQDRGELSDVRCAVGPTPGRAAPSTLALFSALAAAGGWRRRRRAR